MGPHQCPKCGRDSLVVNKKTMSEACSYVIDCGYRVKLGMLLKVKRERGVELPRYASDNASGFDLQSKEETVINPHCTVLVGTGLYFEIPPGYEVQIRSRSGLAGKQGVFVLNSPGTVDADYRGEIKVILHNTSDTPILIEEGSRVAQAVLCPVEKATFLEVEELSETARGEKGFGSTGVR